MFSFLDLDVELSDGYLIILKFINITSHVLALHLKQGKRRVWRTVQATVGAGHGARIHEVATVVLLHAGLVCVARHEHIAVELALDRRESLDVAPRHHVVAMGHSDPEPANLDDLVLGKRDVGVKIALCDVGLPPDRGETLNPLDSLHAWSQSEWGVSLFLTSLEPILPQQITC